MKLLYIITLSEMGGAQIHLRDLIYALNDYNEIHLGIGKEGFLAEEARALGVPVYIIDELVKPLSPIKDVKAVVQLKNLIELVKPDIVHLHSSKAGIVGRLAARLVGIPFVLTVHGWAFTEGTSWKRKAFAIPSEWLAARLLRGQIITVSEYDYRLAKRYFVSTDRQMVVVTNSVPDTVISSKHFDSSGMLRIIMVARFSTQKNHILLVDALAGLRDLPWHLEFVGDGPLLENVQKRTRKLGIQNRICFPGTCSDVTARLSSSDIFVLTSNYEGLPMTILEAMRSGLPVIASNVGGVSELVRNGETGFLIQRGDIDALRARLSCLMSDTSLRFQMGRKGRERYEKKFGFQNMIEKTIKVYDSVLKSLKKTNKYRVIR